MPHQCTDCGRTFADGSKQMLSGCPDCGGNKFQFMPAGAVDRNTDASGGATSGGTAPKKTPETGPSSASDRGSSGSDAGGPASEPETDDRSGGSAVDRAAATVREWVSVRDDEETGRTDSTRNDAPERDSPEGTPTGRTPAERGGESDGEGTDGDWANGDGAMGVPETEDSAQASARRDVVSKSELPDEPPQSGQVSDAPEVHDDENVVDAPENENPGLKELREELNSQFESIRIVNPGQYELNLMELYEREEYIISLQEDGKYVIEVPDAWEQTER